MLQIFVGFTLDFATEPHRRTATIQTLEKTQHPSIKEIPFWPYNPKYCGIFYDYGTLQMFPVPEYSGAVGPPAVTLCATLKTCICEKLHK
jgi:hypothetical protein